MGIDLNRTVRDFEQFLTAHNYILYVVYSSTTVLRCVDNVDTHAIRSFQQLHRYIGFWVEYL